MRGGLFFFFINNTHCALLLSYTLPCFLFSPGRTQVRESSIAEEKTLEEDKQNAGRRRRCWSGLNVNRSEVKKG